LVGIAIGATVFSVSLGAGALALIPVVVGLLAVFVAHGRGQLIPRRPSSRPDVTGRRDRSRTRVVKTDKKHASHQARLRGVGGNLCQLARLDGPNEYVPLGRR
jgi:hypothetical protein